MESVCNGCRVGGTQEPTVGKRVARAFINWSGWLNLTGTAKVATRMARGLNGQWNTGTKGTVGKRVARAFLNWSGWLNLTGTAKVTTSRVERELWRDIY
eukprot:scaffold421586_cov83-Attheya_sp.AAC.1